uniref:hypothetical protein n=1 Tax=Kribbia dieselivorans TaxID=331526 RepID=UPI000A5FF8E2
MHGVEPGTVIGGRYEVIRRVEERVDAERWTAHDTVLNRETVLLCVPTSAPHAEAVLDAARRAAAVVTNRLVGVTDVGIHDNVAWVVEEATPGAQTLAQLSAGRGLPAEEVRRITGEASTALENAARRGLHHLYLHPGSVIVTADGQVKVRGLATEAALRQSDEIDSETGARLDAIHIVGLAYAGLTGKWPLPGESWGLPAAPRDGGRVVPADTLVAGVPGDLNALCTLTLNEGGGPLSPGDYASQVAPWSPTRVVAAPGQVDEDTSVLRTVQPRSAAVGPGAGSMPVGAAGAGVAGAGVAGAAAAAGQV